MPTSNSDPLPEHSNNFDAIRIVAACTVLYDHHYALTGQHEPDFFGLHSWGIAAVIVFFTISGYLVTASWYSDPSAVRFGLRRFLRLWPAYAVVVVLVAYGLGAWVTRLPLGQYWTHHATFENLSLLVLRMYDGLPGVFENNPLPHASNGSVWTIPLEVRCYAALALAGLLGLMRKPLVWLLCIAAYMVWFLIKCSADVHGQVLYGPELSAFFLAGSALFILLPHWQRRPWLWLLVSSACAWAVWSMGWHYTASLILLPFLVVFCGVRSTPVIRRFGRWGDPSYGIYLYAFPVQQTVIHFLWPRWSFAATLALSALATVALAYASWHGVEKYALRLKPRRQ
jgi:peptidoglycan/LPS O-acetylase OafA/YrhL